MIPVYVAGSSAEYVRTRGIVARLISAGLEVPHDWTMVSPEYLGRDCELPPAQRLAIARGDLRAVQECAVFLLLVPRQPAITIGGWVEFGTALELRRRTERPAIVVASSEPNGSIFTDLADVVCDTDDEAVDAVVALAATFGTTSR